MLDFVNLSVIKKTFNVRISVNTKFSIDASFIFAIIQNEIAIKTYFSDKLCQIYIG